MAQRNASAAVEALLNTEDGQPELLSAQLDALNYVTRASLFNKRKNIENIASRLTEARAPAIQARGSTATRPRRAAPRRNCWRSLPLRTACTRAAEPSRGGRRPI